MGLIKCLVGQRSCHVVPYLDVQIVEKLSTCSNSSIFDEALQNST